VISCFRHDIDEICGLLGFYAALSGISVPTFRDNISVPFSSVKKSKKKRKPASQFAICIEEGVGGDW
jgi:predicted membrane metal-binding protein